MKVPADALRCLLDALGAVKAGALEVHGTEEGWKVRTMDPSHVLMVRADITRDVIDDYTEDSFSVDVDRLVRALKVTGYDVDVSITPGIMVLKGGNLTMRLPLTEWDAGEVREVDIPLSVHVQMDADEIRRMLKVADCTGRCDAVTFTVDEDGVRLSCRGDGGAGGDMTVPADECPVLEGEGTATYGVSVLSDATAAVPKGTVLSVDLDTDRPVEFGWGGEGWTMVTLAAPQISQEDQ